MKAPDEKSIFFICCEADSAEFVEQIAGVEIKAIRLEAECLSLPGEVIEDVLGSGPYALYRMVDSRTLRSENLLIEMTGRPDVNSIRLLRLTYLSHHSLLCLSWDGRKGKWKDGEDFWTFVEHADENKRLLRNTTNLFFKNYAFNQAPGWRPSTEIFGLIDS